MNHEFVASIIVPVFNTEKYVESSIESAINQSEQNVEIIVIDDGSTDNSLNVLKSLQKKYSMLRVFHHDNQGPGFTRNVGISKARGKYIFFLDSDDLLDLKTVEMCCKCAEKTDAEVVVFDGIVINSNNENPYDKSKLVEQNIVLSGIEYMQRYESVRYSPEIVMACYSRLFLLEKGIHFSPNLYWEDNLFHCMVMNNAQRVTYLSEKLYKQRVRQNSITRAKTTYKHVADLIEISNLMVTETGGESWIFFSCALNALFAAFNKVGELDSDAEKKELIKLWLAVFRRILSEINDTPINEIIGLLFSIYLLLINEFKSNKEVENTCKELKQEFKNYFSQNKLFWEKSCCVYAIYGTGVRAEKILQVLKLVYRENFLARIIFLDTYAEANEQFLNEYPIYKVNEIEKIKIDKIIVSSRKYRDDILCKMTEVMEKSGHFIEYVCF